MSKIFCVLVVLMLAGCVPTGVEPETISSDAMRSVRRYVDVEAGVVCWTYKSGYAGGISCLPLSQTRLDGG